VLRLRVEVDAPVVALELRELEVTPPRSDFDAEVAAAEAAARAGQVAGTDAARALYRRFGTDPTRHRPSSEALLRRVRKGDPLPRINSLVDVANVLSLRLQAPVGLYDLAKVKGDELVIRRGGDGEGYEGIRKEWVGLDGRLCVADAEGACGNPSSDSARTQITTATERAAWIYFLPVDDAAIDRTLELVTRYGRGLGAPL
jgi:DNA/RNA-binding domain of Phe-tRNA-synthetase-like protein